MNQIAKLLITNITPNENVSNYLNNGYTYAGYKWHKPDGSYAADPNKNSGDHYLNRPGIRKSTEHNITEGRGAVVDGRQTYYDANSGNDIDGQVDIGHVAGHEFWRCRDAAESLGWTQSQFNDFMNNPNFYQFEDHSSNIKHTMKIRVKILLRLLMKWKNMQEKEVGSIK